MNVLEGPCSFLLSDTHLCKDDLMLVSYLQRFLMQQTGWTCIAFYDGQEYIHNILNLRRFHIRQMAV